MENFFLNCKPYKHQVDELKNAILTNSRALLWECGTGKTLAAITILRSKFAIHKRMMRTLILTPSVTIGNWKSEILSFSKINEKDIVTLQDASKRENTLLTSCFPENKPVQDKIVIVNYEALLGNIFSLLAQWRPEILILDEMHYLKNFKSKRTKAALQLSFNAKYKFGLTGTAILNSISDIFSQYQVLEPSIFGNNFFVFQRTYMYDANSLWAGRPNYFPKWKPRPEMFEDLNFKIGKIASIVHKETCLDLPPLVKMKRSVEMSKEQAKIYKSMKEDLVAFLSDTETTSASIALVKALRLQQIVCGFVTTDDGVVKEIPGNNPRLSLVEELLAEITPNHKVILWCCFKHNYGQLAKICEKLKIKYVMLTGEQDNAEKEESMQSFRGDTDCRCIIANRHAGGIGINLVEASYSIVYSRNFSLADELQSEARNYRGGSERHEKITKIDIYAENTIDEVVFSALSNKQDIASIVLKEFNNEIAD